MYVVVVLLVKGEMEGRKKAKLFQPIVRPIIIIHSLVLVRSGVCKENPLNVSFVRKIVGRCNRFFFSKSTTNKEDLPHQQQVWVCDVKFPDFFVKCAVGKKKR